MSTSQFADRAPDISQITAYDENHLTDYLRLLDADDEGADWREAAACILGIDVIAEPHRAKTMHDSHLARARWMTEVGYAHLLGCDRPFKALRFQSNSVASLISGAAFTAWLSATFALFARYSTGDAELPEIRARRG